MVKSARTTAARPVPMSDHSPHPSPDPPGGAPHAHAPGEAEPHAHDHRGAAHDHHDARHLSERALWIALVVLSVFFVVELIGGLLTNSLALISDAGHLLSDVGAVALALFAQWFARKPSSALRTFGYRRVEILAALLNGFTLLIVAVFIAVEAYRRMHDPPNVQTWPMIVVASVGLVAQLLTTLVLARARDESLNVRGAYLHAMTDAVQSVGVVGAGIVMLLTGWFLVDPLVSVLIALLIVYSGGKIIWEATHVLIEGAPPGVDLDRVARLMQETEGVRQVTDLHAWSLTTGYNALSAHVVVRPDLGEGGRDRLRRALHERLCRTFPLQHVTLQVEAECVECQVSDCCGWIKEGGAGESGPAVE